MSCTKANGSFFRRCVLWNKLKKNAKSNSTLQLLNGDDDDEGTHDNMSCEPKANSPGDAPGPSKRRKKTLVETKNALLSKCVGILEQPKVQPQPTPIEPFAVYISKQLESLDPRRKLIAEKRIDDILFEIRMEEYSNPRLNQSSQATPFATGPFTTLLQGNIPNFYGGQLNE